VTTISGHIVSGSTKVRKRLLSPKARRRAEEVAFSAATYYRENGRAFPWRNTRDPFHLAVAEILLQKTRAESIVGVYTSLVAEYPTARALSSASHVEVELRLRSLGLSRKRAGQLIGMARIVCEAGDEIFDDWRRLLADAPGLGAYAARAIACFAKGEVIGIVDANVARIERRVFRIAAHDPRARIFQRYADKVALAAIDARETNFGLLDLGALVCLPDPRCEACPLDRICSKYGVNKRSKVSSRK
jgi:A/G-specific adenine glycosylase